MVFQLGNVGIPIFQRVELMITCLEKNPLISLNACNWRTKPQLNPRAKILKRLFEIKSQQKI